MLESYLKPVLSKHRGLALGVWGEAGIGKSYTVATTLKNLPCQRLSLHATTPFTSFVGQLRKPKKFPLWAEKTLDKVKQGEEVESSNLITALSTSLAGLAPFVLHLEDIHEASSERLEFLNHLAQTVQKLKGVGLLVTSRQEPVGPFRAIRLGSLSREASDNLLEAELKAILPKEALEFIYSKAAGNPLFTLEYLRFLARQGHLWNDGKTWHWRKPAQEQMPVVVEALLEQMILQAKTVLIQSYVLESKALLPLDASNELWEKVARVNTEELIITTKSLNQQSIFKDKSFAHPLFKEVTLKTLSPERKQNLSRRAINVLHDDPVQAALFVEDAKLEREKSLELFTQAAAHLESINQKMEAVRYMEKALVYATEDKKGQLALKAAQLASKAGDAKALALAQKASHLLADNTEALKIVAHSYALKGNYQEMKVTLEKLDSVEDDFYITCLFSAGAFAEIIQRIETSLDLEKLNENSIYFVAWSYITNGNLTKALEISEKRLKQEQLTLGSKAELLDIRASVLHYQGQYQEADPIFSEIIELYRQANTAWDGVANGLRNRALNRKLMGKFREVIPDFLDSLNIYAERGATIYYAQTLVMLSEIYFMLGDYGKMEADLLESISIFERVTPQHFYVEALVNLSYLYSKHYLNSVLAIKYSQKALEVSGQVGSTLYESMALIAASNADRLAGNLARALERGNKALELAESGGFKELILKAQYNKGQVLGVLDRQAEARVLFQTAIEECRQVGAIFGVYQIGLELAHLNKDLEAAKEHMHWFEERGLMNQVNIAKRYFPELAATDNPAIVPITEDLPRLDVLGLMQVNPNNKQETIKGRKRQEFLAVLLEARISGRSEMNRLELLDTLYPNEDELKASNNLKELVYSLRDNFGTNAILTAANGYALGNLDSDAETFLKTGDTSLWRGSYLQDLTIESQETVSESLYLLLFEKAKELLELNPKETARVARMLIDYDPYNQEYLKLCLQAFRATNNHKSLNRLYTEAKAKLAEVGEVLPESWQAFLST
jgi:tetratricopeptide (TPR) repeat protein